MRSPGGICTLSAPPQPPLAEVSPLRPPPPLWEGGSPSGHSGQAGQAPRSAGRRARSSPPRPPGERPEIAGLPTSKGRPAHQSARAARRPSLRTHHRSPRALRGKTLQAPWAGPRPRPPDRLAAAPGPPGPVLASGNMGSHAAGEGVRGNNPGLERDPPAREGKRRTPPPLLCKRPERASAPAAAAPGPSGPRPARLSTQVLFPAVTPRTKCPPGASNKNCAVDLTVHFKGASRAHGPGREVRAGRAPGRPPGPRHPSWGPSGPHRPSRPGLRPAGPPRVPDAR